MAGGAGTQAQGGAGAGRRALTDAAAGRCCGKMAELRALVAVKRVIDFAVKVTGPSPPPFPPAGDPAAASFRHPERHAVCVLGGVFP